MELSLSCKFGNMISSVPYEKQKIIKQILNEEKEYSKKKFINMLKSYVFIQNNLKENGKNLLLTMQSLLDLNNIILNTKNPTFRLKQVKPAGYNFHYMDYKIVSFHLQILVDNWNSRYLTPRRFIQSFLEIHPFLDGNGRTSKILFI